MTSASRTEPPGWTNAVTPAARHTSTRVGEREERIRGAGRRRRALASGTARLLDRLPRGVDAARLARAEPDDAPVPDEHDRIRLDVRASRQARSRSRSLRVRSARGGDHLHVEGSSGVMSGAVTRTAPPAVRTSPRVDRSRRRVRSPASEVTTSRRFGLAARTARARRQTDGATTTSRKIEASALRRAGDHDLAGEGHDAAERRHGVARQRRLPRREERRAARRRRTGSCA